MTSRSSEAVIYMRVCVTENPMKEHLHWNIYGCVTELFTIGQLLLHVRMPKWLPQDFRLMFCKCSALRPNTGGGKQTPASSVTSLIYNVDNFKEQ